MAIVFKKQPQRGRGFTLCDETPTSHDMETKGRISQREEEKEGSSKTGTT